MDTRRVRIVVRRLTIALTLTALLFIGAVGVLRFQAERNRIYALPTDCVVESGDILLLGSWTCRGLVVRLAENGSCYAHVGIADVSDGEIWLIHADPSAHGTVREPLRVFLGENTVDAVKVLHANASPEQATKAVAFCRDAAARHIPFDDTFRYNEGDGYYCTELVLRAWSEAGVELLANVKSGDSIYPAELLDSPYLAPVKTR